MLFWHLPSKFGTELKAREVAVRTIRNILENREIFSLSPTMSAEEAARYMAERNVGAAIVLERGQLVGLLSERDILTKVAATGRDPKKTRVSEIMAENLVMVEADRTYEDCLALMKRNGIRHLPVVDSGRLLGLVSLRDLLQVDVSEKEDEIKMMRAYIHGVPPGSQ